MHTHVFVRVHTHVCVHMYVYICKRKQRRQWATWEEVHDRAIAKCGERKLEKEHIRECARAKENKCKISIRTIGCCNLLSGVGRTRKKRKHTHLGLTHPILRFKKQNKKCSETYILASPNPSLFCRALRDFLFGSEAFSSCCIYIHIYIWMHIY